VHELAVCQGLLRQVERVAAANGAHAVDRIRLKVGGLSGVEPPLLERAFEIARFGTVAQNATLEIEPGPIVVACGECGASGAAAVNRLLCPACGDWRVRVIEGEELVLQSIDISEITKEAHHV
jgi:hydrogenase nickel incorporation protein HypA/HybF